MSGQNKEDMMALASLAALGLAIFLGFVKKMNTGLLCTALALLVGRLAGISDDEIIRGFNYSLFLMLLGVTYLFGADGAMQYGWYTDASGMRYFQTNGAMAVNTTLAVGGVTYVFDANGLATAVPVINPATWVTDPATGVTIDTATGAVVPAETVAAAAAAAIAQK